MITVYCGPMFSGKTEHLIAAATKDLANFALAFKPRIDKRYASDAIVSHTGRRLPCNAIDTAGDILHAVKDLPTVSLVAIDEAQFFGAALLPVLQELNDRHVDVHVSGLDLDANRLPFGVMGEVLAMADRVVKLESSCAVCGSPARYSKRVVGGGARVLVGGKNEYQARCALCWEDADA